MLFAEQPRVVIAYGEGMTVQRATGWARLALVVPMVVACALCSLALAHTEEGGPGREELELGIDGYLEVRTLAGHPCAALWKSSVQSRNWDKQTRFPRVVAPSVAGLNWRPRAGSLREGRRCCSCAAAQQSTGGTRTPTQIEAGVHGQNSARHLDPGPRQGAQTFPARHRTSPCPSLGAVFGCVPCAYRLPYSRNTHDAGIGAEREQPTSEGAAACLQESGVAYESEAGRATRRRRTGR
jgi:hypothetical protein